jgi:hypothetical protein
MKINKDITIIVLSLTISILIIYIISSCKNSTNKNFTSVVDINNDNDKLLPLVLVPYDETISIGFTNLVDPTTGNLDLRDTRNYLINQDINIFYNNGTNIDATTYITDDYLSSVGMTRSQFNSNKNIITIKGVSIGDDTTGYSTPKYGVCPLNLYVYYKNINKIVQFNLIRKIVNIHSNTEPFKCIFADIVLTQISNLEQKINYKIQNTDMSKPLSCIITFFN